MYIYIYFCVIVVYCCVILKGPVHQLDMEVLIKGHCRCNQNAISLLKVRVKRNLHILILFYFTLNLGAPTLNLGPPTLNLGAPT